RIGGGDGLVARRLQRGAEGAGAVGQRAVARQGRLAVGAGEVDRARVAGRHVVALIERRYREGERRARGGRRRGTDREVRRGTGRGVDGAAGAGGACVGGVGGGDGLVAQRLQGGAEGADTVGQRAIAGQRGAAVRTGEVDGARVA